jgi:hypothetical protein
MSQDRYDAVDDLAMREVQKAIVDTVLPFTERIPSWLIVLALARVLRAVLRKAPTKQERLELMEPVVAYIQGRTQQPGAGKSQLLWTPDRAN